MISVLARAGEEPVVREFFELFKTPWRFHAAGVPTKILLCSGPDVPANSAALVIVFSSELTATDKTAAQTRDAAASPVMFQHEQTAMPIYGSWLKDETSQQIVFRRTTTENQSCVRVGFDLFAEVRHLLTAGQPVEHAAIPTLERHIEFLRGLILSCHLPLLEIPPCPAGHDFIVCLTHDVDHVGIRNHKLDHTMFGFLFRATVGSGFDVAAGRKTVGQWLKNIFAALCLPLVHLRLARDFWYQFDQYIVLEAGRPSTFFVIPKKGEAGLDADGNRPAMRAASYDAADLRDEWQRLQAAGKEVTVHGLDAWRDPAAGRSESAIISGLVNRNATGIRMHWLYFDAAAPEKLEAAGYVYDSTVGYNQTVGFRAGTAQVFKPLNAGTLLELPMLVMDTALFYPSYLKLAPAGADAVVFPIIENVAHNGGVLTVNWHDRSLAPERLWGDYYSHLLTKLSAQKAWFATAGQAVEWFRGRRAATFEALSPDGNRVQVKLSGVAGERLPALCVRIFQPGNPGPAYTEQPVADGAEISLAA